MRKITKITHYWFLKPIEENSEKYYIRSKSDDNVDIDWFVGTQNHKGEIFKVGGNMTIAQKNQLEEEFGRNVSDYCEYLSPTCAECHSLITA